MIAFCTTIGEPTTDLCVWSLKRSGFEVHTISGEDSLAEKLKRIYEEAYNLDVDFIRVDADVVPNRNLTEPSIRQIPSNSTWWIQFQTYDWYKQDITNGGIQFIKREALPILKKYVDGVKNIERPETFLYRVAEFQNPRRCVTHEAIMGIHNYRNDMDRVRATKHRRNQHLEYDWVLAEKLEKL